MHHHDSSWCIMMTHQDASWWVITTSSWCIMMSRRNASWWVIMMQLCRSTCIKYLHVGKSCRFVFVYICAYLFHLRVDVIVFWCVLYACLCVYMCLEIFDMRFDVLHIHVHVCYIRFDPGISHKSFTIRECICMISGSLVVIKYIAWRAFNIRCCETVYCLVRLQNPLF